MLEQAVSDFLAQISDFATRAVTRLGDQIESVLYYPHPFHIGGLVVVLSDEAEPFLDAAGALYECLGMRISLHCLRRAELFKLSLPGIFVLPNPVSEHMHLALWLKHRGVVVYGRDLRGEILEPINLHLWLKAHIEACLHFVRPGFILRHLMDESYAELIGVIDAQIRYLMATALLVRGIWDVSMETLPAHFDSVYADEQMEDIWQKFSLLRETAMADTAISHEAACESVWLFERFLRQLGRYAQ